MKKNLKSCIILSYWTNYGTWKFNMVFGSSCLQLQIKPSFFIPVTSGLGMSYFSRECKMNHCHASDQSEHPGVFEIKDSYSLEESMKIYHTTTWNAGLVFSFSFDLCLIVKFPRLRSS